MKVPLVARHRMNREHQGSGVGEGLFYLLVISIVCSGSVIGPRCLCKTNIKDVGR